MHESPTAASARDWGAVSNALRELPAIANSLEEGNLDIITFATERLARSSPNIGAVGLIWNLAVDALIVATPSWIGVMPQCQLKPGDEMWILFGSFVPVALRPTEQGYIVIGPMAVPGFMKGEAVKGLDPSKPIHDGEICGSEGQCTVRTVDLH